MDLSTEAILEALKLVNDPELNRSIVELGMIKNISVKEAIVHVEVALTTQGCPLKGKIEEDIKAAIQEIGEPSEIKVEFGVMSDDERAKVRELIHGDPSSTAGSQPSHGHAEGRVIPFADPASNTRVLLIASGKGGVGKSSVSTNLSIALANRGKEVGIVDADVWGFSIPKMMGLDQPPTVIDDLLIPPKKYGVKAISMGFFAREDQPVIWRGPMLHKALEQFLTDVYWEDLDYLLIDLPPGTGDIALSLAQFLPRSELYVVTTPQPAAQRVAQRAAFMARNVNLEVKGVIENMSWFTGDDNKKYHLFGQGGGEELAERLEVPLIGQIPLIPEVREGSDTGDPIVAAMPESEAGEIFAKISETIDIDLAPTRRYNKGLKLLQ
ncbi:MAG: Mrp/NBP35 family ATP-binding protein [Acidimicrobiales bacterium]|nr:Mrp/NBP35 family ATP-binding protein [Acidimicrobiales bacterium]